METSHVCRLCGTQFTAQRGGSKKSDVLHCDVCGARTHVLRPMPGDDLFHLAVKAHGLYPIPGQNAYHIPPEAGQYRTVVEGRLGPCACGGRFRFAGPPRCPGCRSTEEMWDVDESRVAFYD